MSVAAKPLASNRRKSDKPKRKNVSSPNPQLASPLFVAASGEMRDNPLYVAPVRVDSKSESAVRWDFKYGETRETKDGRGKGLFAKIDIPKGAIICPYLGKLFSKVVDGSHVFTHNFAYDLAENNAPVDIHRVHYSIDADPSHFPSELKGLELGGSANEPNPDEKENVGIFLGPMINLSATIPMIVALHEIKKDSELLWHYGPGYLGRTYSVMKIDSDAPLQNRCISLSDKQVSGIVDLLAMLNPDLNLPARFAQLTGVETEPTPAEKKLKSSSNLPACVAASSSSS